MVHLYVMNIRLEKNSRDKKLHFLFLLLLEKYLLLLCTMNADDRRRQWCIADFL